MNLRNVALEEKKWHVLSEDVALGPFSHLEMIEKIQKKSISPDDYVYSNELDDWQQVKHLPELTNSEKIKDLFLKDTYKKYFENRTFNRAELLTDVVVHVFKDVWTVKSHEIGAGGIGLVFQSEALKLGQRVIIHKKNKLGIPGFNALCEVVCCFGFLDDQGKTQYRYGLKFLNINKDIQSKIKSFTQ
jgi:hypothetical protein